MAKTILVVGASRGLGLGLVRAYLDAGWNVIATSRGNDGGLRDLAASEPERLRLEPLDVTDGASLVALEDKLADTTLDVLFVNAGVMSDRDSIAGHVAPDEFARLMLTNALAPLTIIERLGSGVAPDGVLVAMTSVMGSVGDNTKGGIEVYRASKAALNSLLRSYAARYPQRAIVAMHPGWVRTDMGGAGAEISIEESVRGILSAVAARRGTPGCVFIDYRGRTIPW